MIWHNATAEQVILELGTNQSLGLTTTEAELRLKDYGRNELKTKKQSGLLLHLLNSLKSFVFIALFVVALVNFILAVALDLSNKYQSLMLIAIALLATLLVATFKYFSDLMLEKSLGDSTTNVTVIRNGQETTISSDLLVPGDIMLIKSGDYIKADGRLIDSYALTCDEAMVCGDMAPNEKLHNILLEDITPLADRHNMVYNSTTVLNGHGTVVVTETAFSTEVGKRKDMQIQLEDTETPLLIKLNRIKHIAGTVAVWSAIITFALGILANFSNTNVSFAVTVASNLLLAVTLYFSIGASLIPSILTFSKAFTVHRLKKKGIILNSNSIAEELKDISVICADKTGVLTTEEHTVVKVYAGNNTFMLKEKPGDESVAALLRLSLICCNFTKVEHGERHSNNIERSIEKACIDYIGTSKTDIDGLYPKIAELPFDSDRMLMTTVTAINGNPVSITKGAPEVVLTRCANIELDSAWQVVGNFAKEGLKVIAVAIKQLDEIPANPNSDELENELTFVGIIGIEDIISPKAARVCIEAASRGIKTIMVTGDHIDTAVAISKNAGIITEESQAISGEELALLTDEQLIQNIGNYSVFARISPEDKLRIVNALKVNGEKVLITGDSINDTPALLEADIGCALGFTASDIVKDSADLILEDNHYSSIVYAIKESYKIFSNIKKSVVHLFTLDISLILLTVLGLLIFGRSPLSAPSILLFSLITIVFPLLSFFIDSSNYVITTNNKKQSLIGKSELLKLTIPTAILTIMSLVCFGISLSGVFAVLLIGSITHSACLLLNGSVVSKSIIEQKSSLLLLIIPIILLFILAPIISLTITHIDWIFSIIVLVLTIITHEIIKFASK